MLYGNKGTKWMKIAHQRGRKEGGLQGRDRKQKFSYILKTGGDRKNSATLFVARKKPRLLVSPSSLFI